MWETTNINQMEQRGLQTPTLSEKRPRERESADEVSSPYLVNFESMNEGHQPILLDADTFPQVHYNSLCKPRKSQKRASIANCFFVDPKNLNSPSFFLKKAQIILQKNKKQRGLKNRLRTPDLLDSASRLPLDLFRQRLAKTESLVLSPVSQQSLLPSSESEKSDEYCDDITNISSAQINSKILQDLVANIKFILSNRKVFYHSVLSFDSSEVIELWGKRDPTIRRFAVLLSCLLLSHKTLKFEFFKKHRLNFSPGKVLLNDPHTLKFRFVDTFQDSLALFLNRHFGTHIGREDSFALAVAVGYFREKFKAQFLGGMDQYATRDNQHLAARIKGILESYLNAPNVALSHAVDSIYDRRSSLDDASSGKCSLQIVPKDVQDSIRGLAKVLLIVLEFDEAFYEGVLFRIISQVSGLDSNLKADTGVKREFDDLVDSSENNQALWLETGATSPLLASPPLEKAPQVRDFYNKMTPEPKSRGESFTSSPNPKRPRRNGIFWHLNFNSLCRRMFEHIFYKIIQLQASGDHRSRHVRKGRKILERLQDKFGIDLSQSIQRENVLVLIGILQSKITTVFKNKGKFFTDASVRSLLSEEKVNYLFEDHLLFDIDFTPKCDNLPDCDSSMVGIEIRRAEMAKLSNVANLSQITVDESDYVSSRLKDYLSTDKNIMEPAETFKQALCSIQERDAEDKSAQGVPSLARGSAEEQGPLRGIKELRKSYISIEIESQESKTDAEDKGVSQEKFEKGFRDLNESENLMMTRVLQSKNLVTPVQRKRLEKRLQRLSIGGDRANDRKRRRCQQNPLFAELLSQ